MAPDRDFGGQALRGGACHRRDQHRSSAVSDPSIDSFNGLSIDSSIDLSVDSATALAPSLVGHPARDCATVGRRVVIGSRLEAGLRRAARQVDPLAFGVGKLLEQRAADRLGGLIIGFVGGDAFTHVEHLVLPCDPSQCSAQIDRAAASAYLAALQTESAREAKTTTGDLGTAFL